MFFTRILCPLIIWMGVGIYSPCYAQPSPAAEPPPAAELPTPTPPEETRPDPTAQTRMRVAEARRLWGVALAEKRAGRVQEARVSYVRYLKAAYLANANPWLLLELGRTQEQLGQMDLALTSYKDYLMNAPAQTDHPGDREEAEQAVSRLEEIRNPHQPGQQAPGSPERTQLAPAPPPLSVQEKPGFRGEIELGASYRWNASDPVVGGNIQLVLGTQYRLAQLGAVLRLEASGTLTGLPLVLPGVGFTIMFPVHRRVRVGSTESLGLLAVKRTSASEGDPLVSYLFEVSADLKVDLYVRPTGQRLYLHVAPGYEYLGLIGSGFVGRCALGYRFGGSR